MNKRVFLLFPLFFGLGTLLFIATSNISILSDLETTLDGLSVSYVLQNETKVQSEGVEYKFHTETSKG